MTTKSQQDRVFINEVVTRDGFQMESQFIATEDKIKFIDQLSQIGYSKIEVTSFTSAKAIPALKDAEIVMGSIARNPNVVYTALIPNLRGAERALDCKVEEFNLVMSVSETHNRVNLGMVRDQSAQQLSGVIELAKKHAIPVNISLSACFGCPMEGDVELKSVLQWISYFSERAVEGITLCDTTGVAYPSQVKALCGAVLQQEVSTEFTAHFHNTRGMGAVNAMAAYSAGIRRFDASAGGLGGCPYAPGASGNICTEDLVHLLELEGISTGIDLEKLIQASKQLPHLIGHDVPSHLVKAGHRSRRYPVPLSGSFV
jgi:hydroxymethylglutaryl-CoA lyase